MATRGAVSLAESFSELEDPRADYGKRHLLPDIIVIAVCKDESARRIKMRLP